MSIIAYMNIDNIRLRNFRSYKDGSFEFSPGVNIIVGPNTSGKTNLLEAVMYLSGGKSYRSPDKDLVSNNAKWLKLDGYFGSAKRSVEYEQETQTKTTTINEKDYKRLRYEQIVPYVLFEPSHLSLFSSGPSRRRDYLDSVLEKTNPNYTKTLRDYNRNLSQRNTLLKQQHLQKTMFVWDIRLAEIGSLIAQARQDYIKKLNKSLSKLYSDMANKNYEVAINYVSSASLGQYGSSMLKILQSSINEDRRKGHTSCGPHRDDIEVMIGSRPVSGHASRGEVRTIVLCLKYLELKSIEESRNDKPILLLDDVFSELDGARRRALTELFSTHQTFITTTDADLILQHFTETCNIIAL